MNLKEAKYRFKGVADKTGILTSEVIVEPSNDERDELWDIVQVFAKRLYELDIKTDADQDEINELSHSAIVALHWNDLYISDDRFSYENGRFRRDTIALALCLFSRISRDYKEYDSLKNGWIKPHINFSLLMWSLRSIIDCKTDNLFHLFSEDEAKSAMDLFMELLDRNRKKGIIGYVSMQEVEDEHPLKLIWWEIYWRFNSARTPYQFILNYIWGHPMAFGAVALTPNDREMNKAYLKQQIEHKQFPSEWSFSNDLAYVYLFFAAETDGTLAESEIKQIKSKIMEWNSGDDEEQLIADVKKIYDTSKILFDSDASKERFSFSLENIRRHLFNVKDGDLEKINTQLSFVVNDLVAIAKADEVIVKEEYDLLEEIRSMWGLEIKLFDEEIVAQFNAELSNTSEETLEENTQRTSEYLENYPGDLYCENEYWWRSGRPLRISSFPNVFDESDHQYEDLFRRFTQEEVDLISNKIRSSGSLIYLNFVRDILANKFDLRGMKTPFWFSPFVIFGTDNAGVLYFEQNGIYSNYKGPSDISMVVHCDLWDHISCKAGYNGLTDDLAPEIGGDEDEDVLSSLKIEYEYEGSAYAINIVETHGKKYASTLPIVQAIWENAWQSVIDRSKDAGCFLLGPPPFTEFFNSWDELIDWSRSKDETRTKGTDLSETDNLEKGD